jgi:sulfur-carrier protein adenylyltransferase/sulfurtransferase
MSAIPFEITVEELKEMRDKNLPHRLIDCRESDEFNASNIGGELMPMNTIPSRLQDLDPDEDIIVYCKVGGRSAMVVEYLRRNGFDNARNLRGGIYAWSENIDPTIPKY